jgi:hypothetical protein
MTSTVTTAPSTVERVGATSAVVAGLTAVVLGATAAISPATVGSGWFATGGTMALLFAAGVVGTRRGLGGPRTTMVALGVAACATVLFGLAHFYAVLDEDTAVLLFSVFMIVGAGALVVAGAAAVRAGTGTALQRTALLLTGIWPIATIPAGAALGGLPHFLAIALWGVCWVLLGVSLFRRGGGS